MENYIVYILLGIIIFILTILLIKSFNNASVKSIETNISNLITNNHILTSNAQEILKNNTEDSIHDIQEALNSFINESLRQQIVYQKQFSDSLDTFNRTNRDNSAQQNKFIIDSIKGLQESNEQRLNEIKTVVDEKLTETINKNLSDSFKNVADQLNQLYKSLGEMKNLSEGVTTNVTSLNRILTNVKARGSWAEVQLGNILDQTIPNAYVTNYSPNNDNNRVEFAVKIPANNNSIVYLPIDSKLPVENYIRLCNAIDNGNVMLADACRKSLEHTVIEEAKDISKYISVPQTTPYAIMYLATEGLYSEIISSKSGLPEKIQSQYNIMIAGPTTITALLNSLALGFKAVAINEKADEVRQLLEATRTQYSKFTTLLDKAKKQLDLASNTIGEAQDRNRIINKKLHNLSALDDSKADQLLGLNQEIDK